MKSFLATKTPGCVAAAASVLGDKWTPMLIRALSQETQRFCALQTLAGGVNPRTLSARLMKLEQGGIITKVIYPEVPPRTEYALTDKGRDLLPVLEQMAKWGDKYGDSSI
jgi:DNA-binding HxlR family transcriptional regulator